MNHKINLGIQIIPIAATKVCYDVIDKCIAHIQQSGIQHQITAFETILEGDYQETMQLVNELHQLALSRTEEIVINIRIHAKASADVEAKDKTKKFN